MNTPNPKVDDFLSKTTQWQEELKTLRRIVQASELTEDIKWGVPCYTLEKKNIVCIHGFKEYFALLFFKGALIKDEQNLLYAQTENVQAGRQLRFTSSQEIMALEPVINNYIAQAIAIEKAGLKVTLKKTSDLDLPSEFQSVLETNRAVKLAFEALTPGRQRAYILYFSAPKQAKTRQTRIEKCLEQILSGKGLNDPGR